MRVRQQNLNKGVFVMKIGQRVLLVTYSLLVMAIVVLFALVVCGFLGTDTTVEFIKSISGNLLYTCSIIIIALALIVISFCMMFLGTNKRETSTVLKSTDNGSIRISIDTVNTIAAKAVKGVAGVRDARVNAANTEKGMVINVKIALMSETVVPEVTLQVQSVVKSQIESVVGLIVNAVPVMVDNSIVANN